MITLARQRVHGHLWPILQTAVAAVSAWYIAVLAGVEHRPTFAAIAAIISLGAAFGERRQRAVQLIGGVMLGIVLADLLVRAIGTGLPQIGLLVVLAMLAAVILGGTELLVTEAAVSAILVSTLSSTPEVRLLDVLIGGGVALIVNTLVFPPEPLTNVSRATNAVFGELGVVLRDAAGALAAGDARMGEAAMIGAGSSRTLTPCARRSCRAAIPRAGRRCAAGPAASSTAMRVSCPTPISRPAPSPF
jgi:uncharacterized membrane protein YgaE (UPF0421/DUF939 family)